MPRQTVYEWAVEYMDGEDIVDAVQQDTFAQVKALADKAENTELVLVRNVWDGNDLEDRSWAYIEDGKLPEYFSDPVGNDTSAKVPKRFHAELRRAI